MVLPPEHRYPWHLSGFVPYDEEVVKMKNVNLSDVMSRAMSDASARNYLITRLRGSIALKMMDVLPDGGHVQHFASAWMLDPSDENLKKGWLLGPWSPDEEEVMRRIWFIRRMCRIAERSDTFPDDVQERYAPLAKDIPDAPWSPEADHVAYILGRLRNLTPWQRHRLAWWTIDEEVWIWMREGRMHKTTALALDSDECAHKMVLAKAEYDAMGSAHPSEAVREGSVIDRLSKAGYFLGKYEAA